MTEKTHKNYFQEILFLAYPVVMGLAARTILGIVDAVMVGRLGDAPLAAVGLGGHISTLTVYSFGSFNVGLQAIVARRFGEKNFTKCGEIINRTMFFILFLGLAGSVIGYFFGPLIIPLLTNDAEVISLGKGYVSIRMLEFFAFAIIGMFRGYFDGLGHTKIFMKAMI